MKRPVIMFNLSGCVVRAEGGSTAVSDNLYGLFGGIMESAVRSQHLNPKDYALDRLKPTFVYYDEGSDIFEFSVRLYTPSEWQAGECKICSNYMKCIDVDAAIKAGRCVKSTSKYAKK